MKLTLKFRPLKIDTRNNITLISGIITFGGFVFHAVSGGYGNGPLPHGKYKLNKYIILEDIESSAPYRKDWKPWYMTLEPLFRTNRTGLLLHPDGNLPGTLGCVGITSNDKEFFSIISDYMDQKIELELEVF